MIRYYHPLHMKTEKIVLSFIAILAGLLVAGIAFFIYSATKSISPGKVPTITITSPTPTPAANVLLTVEQPADESVTPQRTITITGKTTPGATLVLTTQSDDQVVTPTTIGDYSITTTINPGANYITLTAISPSGEEVTKQFTVTSSSEEF